MKQQGTINVRGGVNGNGNKFSNNNYHIKNVNHGGGGKKGGDGENGVVILAAIFAVIVVSAYVYLRHHDEIFLWLTMGVVIAGALHLTTLIPLWRDPDIQYLDAWPVVLGIILTMLQAWLIVTTQDALPRVALEIANQPTVAKGFIAEAFEVWNRFNTKGHRIIVESVTTTMTLAPAIVLNILLGLQHFLESVARTGECPVCETISDWLRICKARGSVVSAILVVIAFLVISGVFTPRSI